MSITNYAAALASTASASLIAIARFPRRRSDPEDTASLAQTLDQLLKKNQQLLESNQKPVGEVAAFRSKGAGPSEARTKVKAKKTTAKIAVWVVSRVRKALG